MPTQSPFAKQRTISIALLFVTGACGLIYEVTWHRYLANLVGSEARAAALILAVFLGGLAVGYHLFGKLSRNRSAKGLIKMTGWLEIGIGLWSFFFPSLYNWMWKYVDVWSKYELAGGFLNALILILLPTILMGGTLPLLTQALSQNLEETGTIHARIYSTNTIGAFFGCIIAGFFLLPSLGLPLTLMYTSLFNLAAGFAFFWVSSAAPKSVVEPEIDHKPDLERAPFILTCLIAFLCGFVAITLQAAAIRLVGFSAGSSEYSFAMVVAVFVFLLAWGAFRVAKKPHSRFNHLWLNQLMVALGLFWLYWTAPSWPYWSHLLRILFSSVTPSFYVYHLALFIGLALALFIPVHGMGRSMPLLFASVTRHLNQAGRNVGIVYFVNTLGCVFGAMIGGYLLFFKFNLDQIVQICISLIALTIPLSIWLLDAKPLRVKKSLVFIPVFVGALILPAWNATHFQVGSFRYRQAVAFSFHGEEEFFKHLDAGESLVYHRDGPTTSVGVVEGHRSMMYRSIIVNGKSDGTTIGPDLRTVLLVGHLPALLNKADLKKVAIVGFGTGITAGNLSLYPQTAEVHVFEISPLVKEYAPLFDFANHNLSQSEKLRWHIGDAYQKILADHQKYSLIASEPSNPWVTGVERLYATDFLELAKQRLEPGGIYSQWFHLYDIAPDTFKMVLNTFGSVFPHVRVLEVGSDVILLGTNEEWGFENLKSLEQKFQIPVVKEALAKIGVDSPEQILALEDLIPSQWAADSGIHTLLLPKLAFQAGFDFFTQAQTPIKKIEHEFQPRLWQRKYLRNSFSTMWFEKHPDQKTLTTTVLSWCGQNKLSFFSGWKDAQRSCRIGLAKAVLDGLLSNQASFSATELAALKQLAKGETLTSVIKTLNGPADVQKLMTFLLDYDSAFFPVKNTDVIDLGRGCLGSMEEAHLRCQVRLVKALAYTGELKDAEELFNRLQGVQQIPQEEKQAMDAYLIEAERVHGNL